MAAPKIKSAEKLAPKIYAYNTPGVTYHDGWTKIGYTEAQSVEDRINEQTHTAGIRWELAWQDDARYTTGGREFFTDRPFHRYLEDQAHVARESGTEWFQVDGAQSHSHFEDFASRKFTVQSEEKSTYTLREEQERAVASTLDYFKRGGTEFLWNAKPRFGKTLCSYDLMQRMGAQKVLVLSNRPSVSNSWAEDFYKFIGWKGEWSFVSDNEAIARCRGVMSRAAYTRALDGGGAQKMVAFESLQGLKGSMYFGGNVDKLKWIADLKFDLVIMDESQEGVDTFRTGFAMRSLKRRHTLYLSGTAFKALASGQFKDTQIFNWSYADEQAARRAWTGESANPYERLPSMALYTYQLSEMIADKVRRGMPIGDEGETLDYAFDLNEFFATKENGEFVHKDDVKRFLDALKTLEKYPFSTPQLRAELPHTLWILDRVASVKALEAMLREDDVFKNYKVVIAAGDGRAADAEDSDAAARRAYEAVKKAIAENERTITLSVGKLTVGVTVPEWSGVMMLCNMSSASSYIQAVFRAQNPHTFERDGEQYRKERAYVFDFDPARTLIVYDEFARNLCAASTRTNAETSETAQEPVRRLLNFFPVIGEDDEGRMVELSSEQVLTLPNKVKSREVVRSGFMSNFLFDNISGIFRAQGSVLDIVGKFAIASEQKARTEPDLNQVDGIETDEDGNVLVSNEITVGVATDIFGDKIYDTLETTMDGSMPDAVEIPENTVSPVAQVMREVEKTSKTASDAVVSAVREKVIAPLVNARDMNSSTAKALERGLRNKVEERLREADTRCRQEVTIAENRRAEALERAQTQAERDKAAADYTEAVKEALDEHGETLVSIAREVSQSAPEDITGQVLVIEQERKKADAEGAIRAHLRGFSRTIPSFIMAYGDRELQLSNFDTRVPADVFKEVTGITIEEFLYLRDGGRRTNPTTGIEENFAGGLFNAVVFNASVQEFLDKKEALANYFDEKQDEDIFVYIPPQKTNQVFTPRAVVRDMVDRLEVENPGCFDDPNKTFADFYMKSGLYIAEIVKRLYRSDAMRRAIPDDAKRLRHILTHQVYGAAPTQIIYRIATNFILGFKDAPTLEDCSGNFIQADMVEAIKSGKVNQLMARFKM